ncbi:MAG: CDP-alcohol phosphatidyltransferase family protein, partial [Acidobacteria bacterium]|nr:CDP-alcohol phosphatidyltransferase family protein [Acidobacteriota bacterium]
MADLAAALPLLLLVTLTTGAVFDLPVSYVWQALGLYAGLCALVLATVPPDLPGRGLGAANRVTLGRAMVTLPVAALIGQPSIHHDGGHWWVIVLSTGVMITDGFDGWTARRTGTATPFGARFDMELDSVLMLALA